MFVDLQTKVGMYIILGGDVNLCPQMVEDCVKDLCIFAEEQTINHI